MPRNKEVETWLAAYDNPMKDVVLRVREIVLAADPRIEECIKWKSPTFTFSGNLASFNPRSKKHASLMFHTGAAIPGEHPRLQGGGDTARYMTFADVAEAEAARPDLEAIVAAWCDWKSAAKPPTKKKTTATKKKTTATKKTATKKKKTATKKKKSATKKTTTRK